MWPTGTWSAYPGVSCGTLEESLLTISWILTSWKGLKRCARLHVQHSTNTIFLAFWFILAVEDGSRSFTGNLLECLGATDITCVCIHKEERLDLWHTSDNTVKCNQLAEMHASHLAYGHGDIRFKRFKIKRTGPGLTMEHMELNGTHYFLSKCAGKPSCWPSVCSLRSRCWWRRISMTSSLSLMSLVEWASARQQLHRTERHNAWYCSGYELPAWLLFFHAA